MEERERAVERWQTKVESAMERVARGSDVIFEREDLLVYRRVTEFRVVYSNFTQTALN